MNRGTVGFLLNECRVDDLYDGKNYLKKVIILKVCGGRFIQMSRVEFQKKSEPSNSFLEEILG